MRTISLKTPKPMNSVQVEVLSKCCGGVQSFSGVERTVSDDFDKKLNYQRLVEIDINALFSVGKRPASSLGDVSRKRVRLESDTLVISSEILSSSPQFPPSSAPLLLISDTTL